MSATGPRDKFTGKHTTLDVKTPDLEELEESAYAEPVSVKDRPHPFLTYSHDIFDPPSPLFPISGIRKRRPRPLKQQPSHPNHHFLRWLQLQQRALYLAAGPRPGSTSPLRRSGFSRKAERRAQQRLLEYSQTLYPSYPPLRTLLRQKNKLLLKSSLRSPAQSAKLGMPRRS